MPNVILHLGSLRLPVTGLFAAVGVLLALLLAQRTARAADAPPQAVWDTGFTAVMSALIASRLILIAFNWKIFLAFPVLVLTLPSLTGFGVLLAALIVAIYINVRRLPLLVIADAYAAPALLLWAVMALGDLAAGAHYGLPTRSAFSLADPLYGRVLPSEPVTAGLALLAMGLVLRRLYRTHITGAVATYGLILFGLALFFADFLRQPDPLTTSLLLDPMQWFALSVAVAALVLERMLHTIARRNAARRLDDESTDSEPGHAHPGTIQSTAAHPDTASHLKDAEPGESHLHAL
jgi:phosphatidylglycerol:prolipoprotein diacylglycerol transferase